MGHRSKFTFPIPGRKPKEPPTISTPLSKAQKILGNGEINVGSLTVPKSNFRAWDEQSTGGISVSISESSAGHAANDDGHGIVEEDDDEATERNYGHAAWENESGVIPWTLRGAYGSQGTTLKRERSTGSFRTDYVDATTDASSLRRRQSSSTIHTHYEKANMPLCISQQTSNSAIARGLPSKAKALLDVDGAFPVGLHSKKKPPRLDFSLLTGKGRKQQRPRMSQVGPTLRNNHATESRSVLSLNSESVQSHHKGHHLAKNVAKSTPGGGFGSNMSPTGSSRLRATDDTTRQLYDHYEQMLDRHAEFLDEESSDLVLEWGRDQLSSSDRKFFAPLAAPSKPILKGPGVNWTRNGSDSQDIEIIATSTTGPLGHGSNVPAKNDYASSISSHYTRTSKASRTDKSLVDSDRQITSVLSLSDSDSDEDGILSAAKPSPTSQQSFHDGSSASTRHRRPSSTRQSVTESRASNRSQLSGFTQLNDYLTIPNAAPKAPSTRARSNSTIRSNQASTNRASASQRSTPSPQPSRLSDQSTRTTDSYTQYGRLRDSAYTVREAKAVSFRPLASTAEAATLVSSIEMVSSQHHGMTPQRAATRSSDQPTPPMSPVSSNSVEFYLRSPESVRKDSVASDGDSNNARFMAVTRQEEMLLAALRKKRARMRENIIAELEDEGSVRSGDLSDTARNSRQAPSVGGRQEVLGARGASGASGQPSKSSPKGSSLSNSKADEGGHGQRLTHEQLRALRSASAPPSRTSRDRAPSTMVPDRAEAKARHERVLLYLERPATGLENGCDTMGPNPAAGEEEYRYEQQREGRPRSRVVRPGLGKSGFAGQQQQRPRPDLSPMSPSSGAAAAVPPVQLEKVSEDERETDGDPDVDINEDEDEEDYDVIDFDAFPTPAAYLASNGSTSAAGEQEETGRPDSPISPPLTNWNKESSKGTLSSVQVKGKKSAVRLSAVGYMDSTIPYWGDDD
ncbi:hypothetical protein DL762_001843 [Monosporascus cannonballus]|uniref:Uncharacterized protein n=1 Tax=Monosporascus cannonballus TaxID=155416 RepID=A0ABY0HF47_9PEZI|nr:hypothetical protein DL762_001843 [Monosporascus cannonballus]